MVKAGAKKDEGGDDESSSNNNNDGNSDNDHENIDETSQDEENDNRNKNYDIEEEFKRVFRLSQEEQRKCQHIENGVRRFHQEGKASLERYRLASQIIFKKVLQSLRTRLSHGFILEKASIDEFYLDISEYCYCNATTTTDGNDQNSNDDDDVMEKTVIIGKHECDQQRPSSLMSSFNEDDNDIIETALRKACQVACWVRNDVLNDLGFTMSCGISTNKMMAKLSASFGKPNGQAVLHPQFFPKVMAETKITKVRNFGGKLGKEVLKLLHSTTNGSTGNQDLKELANSASMADLSKIPLPALQSSFSSETAQFIFQACQGIDNEPVNETSGALVKSITAFKSFTATNNATVIHNWLELLANEIAERVSQDTARNHRYPKSCALNYSYYATTNGKRPSSGGSTRSQRQSRSLRLSFPSERESIQQKCDSLVRQAMTKLSPIFKEHPLRGVGLSASNFESRDQPQGVASIQSFFVVASSSPTQKSAVGPTESAETLQQQQEQQHATVKKTGSNSSSTNNKKQKVIKSSIDDYLSAKGAQPSSSEATRDETSKSRQSTGNQQSIVDKDLELAKKLQASFDRENYVLSRHRGGGNCATGSRSSTTTTKNEPKTKRIDAFFKKR
jgi:DNA polymerase eta